MEKQVVIAIAVFVLACSLTTFASSVTLDPLFDIHKLSLQFARARGPFNYYKLSLEWPKSVCNTASDEECETPILNDFTIHHLRPYYYPDTRVPPYSDNRRCQISIVTPRPVGVLTENYFKRYGILEDMVKFWPSYYGYTNISRNLEFWRLQWTDSGMCSSYPAYPDYYFKVALQYIKAIDLKKILADEGIIPNNKKYEASAFASAIKKQLGVDVQIRCNKNANNVTQFYEAFLCLSKINALQSCPETNYYDCSASEKILFPSV